VSEAAYFIRARGSDKISFCLYRSTAALTSDQRKRMQRFERRITGRTFRAIIPVTPRGLRPSRRATSFRSIRGSTVLDSLGMPGAECQRRANLRTRRGMPVRQRFSIKNMQTPCKRGPVTLENVSVPMKGIGALEIDTRHTGNPVFMRFPSQTPTLHKRPSNCAKFARGTAENANRCKREGGTK
jgi:hypothetical protein